MLQTENMQNQLTIFLDRIEREENAGTGNNSLAKRGKGKKRAIELERKRKFR